MSIFKDVFIAIAKRMGLELSEKQEVKSDYNDASKPNLTATIANRIATLTMMDSGVSIDGENARAEYLREFLEDYVSDRMAVAAEVALGTGDALVKPWTDGKRIGIDIIQNDDFRVCESVGNYIRSVIIRCETIKVDDDEYTRFEGQKIEEVNGVPVLFINQFVYNGDKEITNPDKFPDAWKGLKTEDYIPNVDHLLFGRYKCPTVNRGNINSVDGVKVTYGLDDVMDKAVEAYERFNSEMEKKETMLFADRTLFRANENGRRTLPKGKEKLFQLVSSKDSSELVHEFSPDMRTEQLDSGIEVNFKMLELLAGFSNGVLTAPSTNFATATEMKASLQLTFAFITKFRKALVNGTDDLLRAVDVICNRNNITPIGEWEVHYDWSSSYIENIEEQFSRLLQTQSINAVSKAEVRAWVMDEDIQTAQERVEEIDNGYTE